MDPRINALDEATAEELRGTSQDIDVVFMYETPQGGSFDQPTIGWLSICDVGCIHLKYRGHGEIAGGDLANAPVVLKGNGAVDSANIIIVGFLKDAADAVVGAEVIGKERKKLEDQRQLVELSGGLTKAPPEVEKWVRDQCEIFSERWDHTATALATICTQDHLVSHRDEVMGQVKEFTRIGKDASGDRDGVVEENTIIWCDSIGSNVAVWSLFNKAVDNDGSPDYSITTIVPPSAMKEAVKMKEAGEVPNQVREPDMIEIEDSLVDLLKGSTPLAEVYAHLEQFRTFADPYLVADVHFFDKSKVAESKAYERGVTAEVVDYKDTFEKDYPGVEHGISWMAVGEYLVGIAWRHTTQDDKDGDFIEFWKEHDLVVKGIEDVTA